MNKASIAALSLLCVAAFASADDEPVTVIRDVQVLTMSDAGALERATVTVQGKKIVGVSSEPADAPEGARIIDGNGKTLMPGLADMHVHVWSEEQGPLFLANSVTTLRNMWGSAGTLELDAGAKRGWYAGPHVYTPGPLMDGPEPIWGEGSMKITSVEQAVGAVESQRTTGYRAVKLYEGLTPEIFAAAVKAAKDRKMQVYTHVPDGMTVEQVIAAGVDSIEHFEGVGSSTANADEGAGYMARWASADRGKLEALARLSAESGVWHSPTMAVIYKRYEYGANADAYFARPETGYIGTGLSGWWRGAAARMGEYTDEKQAAADNKRAFLKMLYDAGAPLLLGTDTPNPFVMPGFAIHDELASFVEAGIPVEDVLRIATADAAKFLREEGKWGVIAAEARADLVLLDADPRDDLTTLRRPAGVMVNGHWYSSDVLAAELEEIRAGVEQAAAAEGD